MTKHQNEMFSLAASGATPVPITEEEIDFDAEPTVPVPLEPNEPQGPAVPSPGARQDEQRPGGVLSGQPQGGDQPQRAKESRRGKGEPEQIALLTVPEPWEEHYRGMPPFRQENLMPWKSIYVHFENREDMENFSKLVGQKIGLNTRFIWHPAADIDKVAHMAWVDKEPELPEPDEDMIETLDEG